MSRFGKFLFVCAFIIGGGYAACQILYPTLYLRYKLTVNISDHGAIKTGSGVIEISYSLGTDIFEYAGPSGAYGVMHGNAITVDLGKDGLVFVINRRAGWPPGYRGKPSATLWDLPLVVSGLGGGLRKSSVMKRDVPAAQSLLRTPVDVPAWAMPAMVRFRNIDDPRSVELLIASDLSESLGEGVHFDSATLELTDEPITPTPADWPGWLKSGDPWTIIVSPSVTYPAPIWRVVLQGLRIRDFRGSE